jgi:branched-chain amino acid transport system substrate-binding protein
MNEHSAIIKISRRSFLAAASALSAAAVLRPAFASDPIKIGFGISLTGPNSPAGKMFLVAREVWKDEVNQRGGIFGRPVEFVSYDDQSNPSLVPSLYSKLLDVDKVDLLLSGFGTNQIAPAMPIVMARKKLFLGLFGTGVNDHFKYDRYFQILPNGPEGNESLSGGFFETALTLEPKPQTVALVGEDTEFGHNVLLGARENAARAGLKIVYDRNVPPTTADYTPIVRSIAAANPDVVFVATYPAGSVGVVRSVREVGYTPRMFGGAMIGLQFTPIKAQLGPMLNGMVVNENYVPEPTMKFEGAGDVLKRYQQRAAGQGVDPLGFWSLFGYAQLQILEQVLGAVGSINEAKLADYMHKTPFKTVVGDVKFGPLGEWEKSRILFVQYQNVAGHDFNQFRNPGKAVIISPKELKSGELIDPFAKASGQ